MRPVIVEALNSYFQTGIFAWLVPNTKIIYTIAFVLVMAIFVNRSSKIGLSKTYAFWSGIWAIVFGMLGLKMYHLLSNFNNLVKNSAIIFADVPEAISWVGYIAGIGGFLLFLRLNRAPILRYLDALCSTLGLGVFIVRWNCFLYGCCFGLPSSLPWAISFPKGSPAYNAHLLRGYITPEAKISLPVHPFQIYLSLNGLFLFVLTSLFWQKLKYKPGMTFCLFWLSYCITTFYLEFFRDTIRHKLFIGSLSSSQIISTLLIPLFTIGLWQWWKVEYKK
jgi:phosphatidylglycerol:prolipoprotein diacylglycerol transferase